MEIFQPSLFGSKAEFDKDNFEFVIDKGDFCGHIANAIEKALSIVKEYRDENSVTSTLFAQMLHEQVYHCILDEFSKCDYAQDVKFGPCVTGNERLYFVYEGYAFIIRKLDASVNNTKQSKIILNQEADSHIITISYTLDDFRENITSTAFKYIKGNNAIYTHSISAKSQSIEPLQDNADDQEFQKVQPKIKKGIRKEIL